MLLGERRRCEIPGKNQERDLSVDSIEEILVAFSRRKRSYADAACPMDIYRSA